MLSKKMIVGQYELQEKFVGAGAKESAMRTAVVLKPISNVR